MLLTFQPVGAGIGIGSNAMQALMNIGVGEKVFADGHVLQTQVFLNYKGQILNSIDFSYLKNDLDKRILRFIELIYIVHF